jgi:hypothetical protein
MPKRTVAPEETSRGHELAALELAESMLSRIGNLEVRRTAPSNIGFPIE